MTCARLVNHLPRVSPWISYHWQIACRANAPAARRVCSPVLYFVLYFVQVRMNLPCILAVPRSLTKYLSAATQAALLRACHEPLCPFAHYQILHQYTVASVILRCHSTHTLACERTVFSFQSATDSGKRLSAALTGGGGQGGDLAYGVGLSPGSGHWD